MSIAPCLCGETPEIVPVRGRLLPDWKVQVRCPGCGLTGPSTLSRQGAIIAWEKSLKPTPEGWK